MRIPRKGNQSNKSKAQDDGPGPVSPVLAHVRSRGRRRTDAGGAYIVLPVGLVDQLPHELQQQLVDIADQIGQLHPDWAQNITYQVLPWARRRPADLTPEELTWFGITQDMDPAGGDIAYWRSGEQLPPDHVVGHRSTLDVVPVLPGTHPGARPPLLPAMPHTPAPGTGHQAVAVNARLARASQVATIQQRLAILQAADSSVDHAWAQGIATADELWGSDQKWRTLLQNTTHTPTIDVRRPTPAEAPPRPAPAAAAADKSGELSPKTSASTDVGEQADPAPSAAEVAASDSTAAGDDLSEFEGELAALEADLSNIFKPGSSE